MEQLIEEYGGVVVLFIVGIMVVESLKLLLLYL